MITQCYKWSQISNVAHVPPQAQMAELVTYRPCANCFPGDKLDWLPGFSTITLIRSGAVEQEAHVPVHVFVGHMPELTQPHAPDGNAVLSLFACISLFWLDRQNVYCYFPLLAISKLYIQLLQLFLISSISFSYLHWLFKSIYLVIIISQALF